MVVDVVDEIGVCGVIDVTRVEVVPLMAGERSSVSEELGLGVGWGS